MGAPAGDARGQIYAALIGAVAAIAIAVGGFVYQTGQLNGHLDSLEQREQRIETKVDEIQRDTTDLRVRTARIEEHLNGSFRPRADAGPDARR